MILQTRENDIAMFAEIARIDEIESPNNTSKSSNPAFLTSELKRIYHWLFNLYSLFVIDLVVASVLMSMGMMMLSPMMISMPLN